MSVSASVLDLLTRIIPNLIGTAAAMPVPDNFPIEATQVTKFGLSGELGSRRFCSGLEISVGALGAIPIQAVLEGHLSFVGKNVAIEPTRDDASVFLTRQSGLLLQVHPTNEIRRLITETPDDPLEYPFPRWVLYEGVEPDEELRNRMPLEFFATADFFEFDSFALPPSAQPLLERLSLQLDLDRNLSVLLTGYTDAEGAPDHNIELGTNRASAIRDYLINGGVDAVRIDVDSRGERAPKDPNAEDRDAAGINRRVEIELRLKDMQIVHPGDALGTATESVTITIFDELGYFIDPLALILRLRPDLQAHPKASFLDPLSPVIMSHRIHVISENSTQDGPADDYPYFTFQDSITNTLNVAGDNDTIWIDVARLNANVAITRPLSLVGKPVAGHPPNIEPLDNLQPILTAQISSDARRYGLRVIGLLFAKGRSPNGGSALSLNDQRNVLVAHCVFNDNFAGPSPNDTTGNGGAIKLQNCRKILINSCSFWLNHSQRGGAIYAEKCRAFVVTGDAPVGLDELLLSEDSFVVPMPNGGHLAATPTGVPPVLTGQSFSSIFLNNAGVWAGGAIGLKNSSFTIRRTFFAANSSGTIAPGGRPATSTFDPGTVGYGGALGMQMEMGDLTEVESLISNCVAVGNESDYGGAFAAAGSEDNSGALNGNQNSFPGGGRYRILGNAIHQNSANQIGGGIHLVNGSQALVGNRISNNKAVRNGGGCSAMSGAQADLVGNRILFNSVEEGDPDNQEYMNDPVPPNGAGGGGGGIYVSFWPHPLAPKVNMERNRVIGNRSFETGGGLRATCGGQVTLKPGNLFKDNVAFLHGGAVALNSASLTIEPGNSFENNSTRDGREFPDQKRFRGGHGGAIYCYGGEVATRVVFQTLFASCAKDGAVLQILGSEAEPILFVGNASALQGGAIYVEREDNPANFISRMVRGIIRHAIFDNNRATALIMNGTQQLPGTAIAMIHLDTPPLDPLSLNMTPLVTLQDLEIKLVAGVGLYLLDSVELTQRSGLTYVELPGATGVVTEVIA